MTITDIGALLGVIFGTAGLVLGIMNYLRDRPEVVVTLKWDMKVTDNPVYDPNKNWGFVTVSNVGRRPIYISHASITIPKGYGHNYLLLWEGLRGQRLAEGDPPVDYVLAQDKLEKYKKVWKKMRAVVFDTAGKKYYSKVDKSRPPSWAN